MNLLKIITALVVLLIVGSCCKKEAFPNLGKQIEGNYTIYQAQLLFANPSRQTVQYNPKDSAQTGQITIQQIDPLSAVIHMILKKNSGEVLFDDSFECELSRSVDNKGFINFSSQLHNGGAYHGDEQIVDVNMFGTYPGKYAGIGAYFFARR